jgi:hypothetical protein
MESNESALQPTARSPFAKDALPKQVRATMGTDPARPYFNLFLLEPLSTGELVIPQPLHLQDPSEKFHAQVLETCQMLDVKRDPAGNLVITIPNDLAGIDHPVIRIGPASSIPALYEDGSPVVPFKPGTFPK